MKVVIRLNRSQHMVLVAIIGAHCTMKDEPHEFLDVSANPPTSVFDTDLLVLVSSANELELDLPGKPVVTQDMVTAATKALGETITELVSGHKMHACDEEGCGICKGGLDLCTVCGGAEGSMPTECPGERMNSIREEQVYSQNLDFKGGQWHNLKEEL